MNINHMVRSFLALGLSIVAAAANPVLTPGVWTNIGTPETFGIAGGFSASGSYGAPVVTIDQAHPATLWLCVDSRGLWRTTNAGDSWEQVNKPLANTPWTDLGNDTVSDLDSPIRVEVDPRDLNHLYAVQGVRGYAMGFWISHTGGKGWKRTHTSELDLTGLAIDPANFGHLIVTSHDQTNPGVFESRDSGKTFILHPNNYNWGGFSQTTMILHDLRTNQGDENTWILGSNNGFWRTTNAGASWTLATTITTNHVCAGNLYYAKNGTLYIAASTYPMRSTDNGVSWTSITTGLPNANYASIIGDGVNLYTCVTGMPGGQWTYYTSPENDGATWHAYDPFGTGAQTFGDGPYRMQFDTTNRIIYASQWEMGVWALKVNVTKPIVNLSGVPISVTYVTGSSFAQQSKIVTALNIAKSSGFHMSGAVTVSNKRSWLTVSVNASSPDSQILTNTIDPSTFGTSVATYYDTVTVHAVGAEVVDQTYVVKVWVRNPAQLDTIMLSPMSATISSGQSQQFAAQCLDQYGLVMNPQPVVSWTTTDGTVSSAGLFTSAGCPGTVSVTASAQGKSSTAAMTITKQIASQAATVTVSTQVGNTKAGINDGVVGGYPGDASKEWSSNGEKAGAWAQLSWTNPTTIDSIALWDRPNADDQVLSGTLSFSDGSTISVGTLANDASSPWSQKFLAKTISWVKFTVNSVSTTTANIGLAEFGAYNSATCSGTNTEHSATQTHASREILSVTAQGISVNCAGAKSWTLDLYTLNGIKMATFAGKRSTIIPFDKYQQARGFVVAKLRNGASESVLKILSR